MPSTALAADTGLPSAIPSLARSMPRRGFLAGLTRLPLIGGSVALLGQPSAVAEPVTLDLLEAYKTWLDTELRFLTWNMADDPRVLASYGNCLRGLESAEDRMQRSNEIGRYIYHVGDTGRFHAPRSPSPYKRAALVQSAVGCDWRDAEG